MAKTDCRTTEIYSLSEPDTGEVRYVGKTVCGVGQRVSEHISYSRKHRSHCYNWIRSLIRRGLRPVIGILETVQHGDDWQAAERKWIAHFRETTGRMVNGTDGGEGVPGRSWKPSAEQRTNMSAARMGLKQSAETQKKRSESLRRFYEDPAQMAKRKALGSAAGKSAGSRKAASERMKAIWADPERKAAHIEKMRGLKKKEMSQEDKDARSLIAKRLWAEGRITFGRK